MAEMRTAQKDLVQMYWLLEIYKYDHEADREFFESIEAVQGRILKDHGENTTVTDMYKAAGNIRNAGRSSSLSLEQKSQMQKMHAAGMKLKEIAEEFHCSIGLVHKVVGNHRL